MICYSRGIGRHPWCEVMTRSWNSVGAIGVGRDRWSERAAMAACALLVGVIVWLLARLFWSLLSPPDVSIGTATAGAAVVATSAPAVSLSKWHLFGGATTATTGNRSAPATTLALRLRGTLADADARDGIAVIAEDSGAERAWRVGEEIASGVTLAEVHADRVVLLHEGVEEELRLIRDETLAPAADTGRAGAPLRNTAPGVPVGTMPPITFTPPQAGAAAANWQQTMDRIGATPETLAQRVQVVPVINDGKIAGVRVAAAGDPALMAQLGLRPSDIVTAVNGLPVDSVARGQQILESLGSATDVRVTVTRDGRPTEITVKLR